MIRVYHDNGTHDDYAAGATSDSQRGSNLTAVLNLSVAGDTVVVPASGYKLVNLTRNNVRVHLEEGAYIWTDGSGPGAIVSVSSGDHELTGCGVIENLATSGPARGIEVSGGSLRCHANKIISSAPSNGAVVCTGGYLELNAIEVLSRNYDGLEISGSGQVLVDIQKVVAEGNTPSGSSNAIEVRGGDLTMKRVIRAQEVESD